MSYSKKKKKSSKDALLQTSIVNNTPIEFPLVILSIDPGTHFMGWTVSEISSTLKYKILGYGTLYSSNNSMNGLYPVLQSLKGILVTYAPTMCTIEDYVAIPGKTKGMFKVPFLIGMVQYLWYEFSMNEATLIPSTSWKLSICGHGRAQKEDVVSALSVKLPNKIFTEIKSLYSKFRGKKTTDQGEQDCFDAIGQNIYISEAIIYNKKQTPEEI